MRLIRRLALVAAATALTREHDELPAHLEPVADVGTRVAKQLWTVVLNILPHALTLVLIRIRARLKQQSEDQSA